MDTRVWAVMPSLFSPNRSLSRHITWLPIAVSVLATPVALPRVHVFTTPTPAAASGQPPVAVVAPMPLPAPKAGKATTVASNALTYYAVMQHLSDSLAATPGTVGKSGTVMIDVDKASMMMTCSHSDSIAIPVPGGKLRWHPPCSCVTSYPVCQ